MTPRPNLNNLAKEVHEANKLKGFHDKEWSNEHLLCLVISELMEAVEADRKELTSNIDSFEIEVERLQDADNYNDLTFAEAFENYIKDTVEDELCDAVIRLLDLAGLRGCDHLKTVLICPTVSEKKSFTENTFAITLDLVYYKYSIAERIAFALLNIERLCKFLNIDLWQHVELKLMYNQTRPYKHGKSY